MTEIKFNRDQLIEKLKTNKCKVVFTKKDGTQRVMNCTLKQEVVAPLMEIAEAKKKQLLAEGKEVKEKPINLEVVSVVDMEINQWRSFRLDSIISVEEIQ